MIHQKCYGGDILNLKQSELKKLEFFCSRCQYFIDFYNKNSKNCAFDSIYCHFCPNIKGIIKKVTYKHK